MFFSSRNTVPFVGAILPAMILKSVVLPAPFGPIKPVILPFSTSIVALSTALIPPKFTDN